MKKKRKFYPTAALLFTFIAAVTVSDLVNPVRTFSEMENRELKTSSRLTLSRVVSGDFQKRYEEVLADQFVGRDGWITLKSETESALLKTENNGVLYGKNGALFGKLISCNEEQLEKNAGFIRTFAESHENVTFGVIPSGYVYSTDQLPLGNGQLDQKPVIDALRQEMPESVRWFDVYGLLEAEKSESLYYSTDHHWKGTTAFTAYRALCGQMGIDSAFSEDDLTLRKIDSFYGSYYSKCKKAGTAPDTLLFYDLPFAVQAEVDGEQKEGWYDPSQLEKRDKYGAFLYGNGGLTVLRKAGQTPQNPTRILLIKDSFSNCLAPLFLSSFDEVYFVDPRSYPSGMTALCEEKNFDQILVLYNFENLSSDTNIFRILQ